MDKTTVGNLCKPYIGQLKLDDNTLIDYFDIASVDNIEKQITGYTTYKFAEAPSRARKKVEKGNILVSTVRPNLNAVALFDEETENMPVASTGFCVLECKANTSPRFLFRYLQSQSFVRAMVSQATGASYPAVSDKIVRDTKLPAYSYEEQIQIANVLDATANIISKRKHQLQKLDELVKARFIEMFEDGMSPLKNIDELCYCIVDCPHTTPKYEGELKNPAIRTSEIKKGTIVWDTMRYVSDDEYLERTARLVPKAGDIVYGREGTFGNAAILPEGYKFCLGQRVMLLRPDYFKCTSEYLLYAVISDYVYSQALEKNNASTVAHVNVKDVKRFKIPLPPLSKQKQFARFIKQIDKSKTAVQKALDEAQLLFDSLMQKYFE